MGRDAAASQPGRRDAAHGGLRVRDYGAAHSVTAPDLLGGAGTVCADCARSALLRFFVLVLVARARARPFPALSPDYGLLSGVDLRPLQLPAVVDVDRLPLR